MSKGQKIRHQQKMNQKELIAHLSAGMSQAFAKWSKAQLEKNNWKGDASTVRDNLAVWLVKHSQNDITPHLAVKLAVLCVTETNKLVTVDMPKLARFILALPIKDEA